VRRNKKHHHLSPSQGVPKQGCPLSSTVVLKYCLVVRNEIQKKAEKILILFRTKIRAD
jgi:hypothetical protein